MATLPVLAWDKAVQSDPLRQHQATTRPTLLPLKTISNVRGNPCITPSQAVAQTEYPLTGPAAPSKSPRHRVPDRGLRHDAGEVRHAKALPSRWAKAPCSKTSIMTTKMTIQAAPASC
jgi:hypothetical protein